MLKSKYQGINVFVQCIMPDAGGRIKRSAIESMCTMLLSLTSLYETKGFDPKKHPRLCVIFNNVSKISHPKKTVHKYGNRINGEEEKEESQVTWSEYIVLYRNLLIEVLVETYKESLKPAFIKERIKLLFPDDNFCFYQMREDAKEMQLEWEQVEHFLDDCLESPRLFIKSGQLEPMHLSQKERDILVKGMEEMMIKCEQEID